LWRLEMLVRRSIDRLLYRVASEINES
jgi:hypothetical protein